jgi:hypothetical protein
MAAVGDQPYKYQLERFVNCHVFGLLGGNMQTGRKELGRRKGMELCRMYRILSESLTQ